MKKMLPEKIEKKIEAAGIIAVLVIEDEKKAVPLAKTLVNSGITVMELTLRTEAAIGSLKAVTADVIEMTAGAGTVLTKEQLMQVKSAGADFAVAPGLNPEIMKAADEFELPFAPGVCIPSEIEFAIASGCRVLKFFHAEGMGGASYLKGINAPYKHLGIRYFPLGGISLDNMRTYLELPEVIAIGGSWIAPPALINAGDWDSIARNADAAIRVAREVRGAV